MKYLLDLMTVAALGASLAVSCGKDGGNTVPPKPVVTEDMYSVTVHAETAEVLFSFTADAMSAFWTVTEPVGITTSFNGREVTKAFKNNGLYTGSLIAYGKAGQSDPVPFSFTIEGFVPPMTEEEQAAQEALSGKTFYVSAYGWWGEGWDLNYHYGLDAMWTVASIDGDGTVRVEIYQAPQEQWFAVFLSPVE